MWGAPKPKEEKKRYTKEELFVPLSELRPKRKLKIAEYGDFETGKTHFILTCPEPIYVIDTELRTSTLKKKFQGKQIHVLECFAEDAQEGWKADPLASLEVLEQAVESLRDVNDGTIALDSITDVWEWIGDWNRLKFEAEHKREFYQFDWKDANRKYKTIMQKLLSRDAVFVVSARTQDVYLGGEKTGATTASWQKRTPFYVDIVLKFAKVMRGPSIKYLGIIEKCGYERQFNRQIEDLTYDKLYDIIKDFL